MFNLTTEAKHWVLAVRKPREWLRRSEEIAEQYMKRWIVADKEQVAKRRALEVQTAQQTDFVEVKAREGEEEEQR